MRGSVVVCDDDPVHAGIATRLLAAAGWEIVGTVTMAIDAIEVARVAHPDVVVMDISMAGMSGIDAIPELRALGCAVVVCSAFDAGGAAGRAGAAAVVDKSDFATLPDVLAALDIGART